MRPSGQQHKTLGAASGLQRLGAEQQNKAIVRPSGQFKGQGVRDRYRIECGEWIDREQAQERPNSIKIKLERETQLDRERTKERPNAARSRKTLFERGSQVLRGILTVNTEKAGVTRNGHGRQVYTRKSRSDTHVTVVEKQE